MKKISILLTALLLTLALCGTIYAASITQYDHQYSGIGYQILHWGPIGQSFTAENVSIDYIGAYVGPINPINPWESAGPITVSLYEGETLFDPNASDCFTNGALLMSEDIYPEARYEGFINMDVSELDFVVGSSYTFFLSTNTNLWGSKDSAGDQYAGGQKYMRYYPSGNPADPYPEQRDLIFHVITSELDYDDDGVPDEIDNCPESDTSPTVIIDGCDSSVENQPLGEGCKMSDLIEQCAQDVGNHGIFVSCVGHLTNDWKKEGIISEEEKEKLQECAARSLYGKIITAEAESVTIALSKLSCGSWLLYATTSADSEGIYSFCNVPDGTYKVEADHGQSILSPEVYDNILIPKTDSTSLDFIETAD
jgi:hypothetical protein